MLQKLCVTCCSLVFASSFFSRPLCSSLTFFTYVLAPTFTDASATELLFRGKGSCYPSPSPSSFLASFLFSSSFLYYEQFRDGNSRSLAPLCCFHIFVSFGQASGHLVYFIFCSNNTAVSEKLNLRCGILCVYHSY